MKDPLDDIAAELARLQPSGTSERLNRRVAEELGAPAFQPPNVLVPPWWRGWAPLAAAAALAVLTSVAVALKVGTPSRQTAAPVAQGLTSAAPSAVRSPSFAPALRHVRQANYLLDAEDNGLIYTSATTPWRKVRWQVLSASEWRDEADRTTFRVFVPREETMLIPVDIH